MTIWFMKLVNAKERIKVSTSLSGKKKTMENGEFLLIQIFEIKL